MPWIVALECPKIIPAFLGGKGPTTPVGAFFASPAVLKVTSKQEAVQSCAVRSEHVYHSVLSGVKGLLDVLGTHAFVLTFHIWAFGFEDWLPVCMGAREPRPSSSFPTRGFPARRTWTGIG